MEENSTVLKQILRRLDILIALEFEKPVDSSIKLSGKIKRMTELGLSVSEISSIIGKPTNYITATISQQKKSAKRTGDEK